MKKALFRLVVFLGMFFILPFYGGILHREKKSGIYPHILVLSIPLFLLPTINTSASGMDKLSPGVVTYTKL